MNVLFITSSRLGDAVLSTGLLDHIVTRYPGARITAVCGSLPAPLFEGVPGLEKIIILQKKSFNRHWISLWRQVVGQRWDMVVDLRNSAVSRLIRADQRFIFGRHIDQNLHKVEQCTAVMRLNEVPAPRLWFTNTQEKSARNLVPEGNVLVLGVGPTANWRGKMWPAENFIELIRKLTSADGAMPGARVAVFAAPGEEVDARRVLESVLQDRQIDVIAKADPGTVAAALARCDLYIGNDSGLMHCAAAAGVPTLGLFGPSWPHLYRPWGPHTAFVSTPENYAELTAYEGYDPVTAPSLMGSLSVEKTLTAAVELCKNAGDERKSQNCQPCSRTAPARG